MDSDFEDEFDGMICPLLQNKVPEKIDPAQEICEFFSNYALGVGDDLFSEDELSTYNDFFILSGFMQFSKDPHNGRRDLKQIMHNI
jgi:hypothetical protein